MYKASKDRPSITHAKKAGKQKLLTAHPIIQAPPVTNATTGFGPSLFLGKYRSRLPKTNISSIQQSKIKGNNLGTKKLFNNLDFLHTCFQVDHHRLYLCEYDWKRSSYIQLQKDRNQSYKSNIIQDIEKNILELQFTNLEQNQALVKWHNNQELKIL